MFRADPSQRASARVPIGPGQALAAAGPVLRDRAGAPVALRGTNLGGWLMHEGWISPMGDPSLERDGWSASSPSSAPGCEPAMAIGGEATAAWRSGAGSLESRHLRVDMGGVCTFDGVSLVVSRSADGPSHVDVEISVDGADWRPWGSASVEDGRRWMRGPYEAARFISLAGRGWGSSSDDAWLSVAHLGVHVADEVHLRRRLERRFGQAGADRLLAAHQEAWISPADLDGIADLGLNLVRVPFSWQVLLDDAGAMKDQAAAFGRLDWIVAEAGRRGLYVVLDLHGATGGANPADFGGQAGSNRLWTDPAAQEMTERIWRAIAARYVGQPAIAGYDLLNEPVVADTGPEDERQLRIKYDLVDRLYRAVREGDPGHVVLIPAFPALDQAPPPDRYGWTNVVYETHHFGIEAHDDEVGQARFVRSTLEGLATARRTSDVPLLVGEFWLSDFTHLFGAFASGLNDLGISSANWTWKHRQPAGAHFPHGVSQGPNWGFFCDGPGEGPDIDHDDAATIEAAWRRFSTAAFTANDDLARVLGEAARAPRPG